jgi:hypothetical protein
MIRSSLKVIFKPLERGRGKKVPENGCGGKFDGNDGAKSI